jgi:hypothetical protein
VIPVATNAGVFGVVTGDAAAVGESAIEQRLPHGGLEVQSPGANGAVAAAVIDHERPHGGRWRRWRGAFVGFTDRHGQIAGVTAVGVHSDAEANRARKQHPDAAGDGDDEPGR